MKLETRKYERGSLDYGVMWTSLDGRIVINYYDEYKYAEDQAKHLINLGRVPSLVVQFRNFKNFKMRKPKIVNNKII